MFKLNYFGFCTVISNYFKNFVFCINNDTIEKSILYSFEIKSKFGIK
jgi:hypothetical protein